MKQTTLAEAKAIDAKPAKTGIFYDSQKWSDYLKQSLVLNATTVRTIGDPQTNRQPFSIIRKPGITTRTRPPHPERQLKPGSERHRNRLYSIILKEWERTLDPAMVHIGRKICNRHGDHPAKYGKENGSEIAAMSHQTENRPAATNKRFGTRHRCLKRLYFLPAVS